MTLATLIPGSWDLRVPGCTGQRSTQLAESGTFSQLPKRRSWVALRLGCHWVLLSPQTWVQPHSAVLARKQEDSCGRRGLSVSQCPCLPCYSCHFKRCGDSRSWGVLQWAGSSPPRPPCPPSERRCLCGLWAALAYKDTQPSGGFEHCGLSLLEGTATLTTLSSAE